MKKVYNIGISCIGSGVGQSVINSLRLSRLPIKTFGFGTNPFAYGAYDCNVYDYTLSIYDQGYIDNIIDKCKEHKIDIITPGHDDDALIFAQNIHKFEAVGIKVISASKELISLCRDKERMSNVLNKVVNVFTKSYNKNTLIDEIKNGRIRFPFIAKPRGGFGSKGIEIIRSEDDLTKISDEHIVQELAIPMKNDPNYGFYMSQIAKSLNPQVSEISIQLVYSPEGHLMGKMISYNKLNQGIPIEIVPYENEYIWSIIDKLTPHLLKMGLRGPLNIQGRITEDGLKLFEMNPRFTGITGLRALMGFNEVEACVKEWLGIDKGNNQLQFNYNRFGIRQTADKSIPIERNKEVLKLVKQLNEEEIKKKKTILVTGAIGYLGQNLISKLSSVNNNKKFQIWAYDLDKQKTKKIFKNKVDAIYNNDDLNNGRIQFGNVDILLHLGFTRPHGTNHQISESLKFTNELFTRAVTNYVPAIINMSSQCVYGLESTPPWTEETPIAPQMVYAQAKYATELLLESLSKTNNTLKYSSLRLGGLSGGAKGLVEVGFLAKIVHTAYEGNPINIIGGMQRMECFDIRDAVDAIIVMLNKNPENWKPAYNLSSGQSLDLMAIANKSIQIASKFNGNKVSEIILKKKQVKMEFGMDCSLFYLDMNWQPKYGIDDTIESLVTYFQNDLEKTQKRTDSQEVTLSNF